MYAWSNSETNEIISSSKTPLLKPKFIDIDNSIIIKKIIVQYQVALFILTTVGELYYFYSNKLCKVGFDAKIEKIYVIGSYIAAIDFENNIYLMNLTCMITKSHLLNDSHNHQLLDVNTKNTQCDCFFLLIQSNIKINSIINNGIGNTYALSKNNDVYIFSANNSKIPNTIQKLSTNSKITKLYFDKHVTYAISDYKCYFSPKNAIFIFADNFIEFTQPIQKVIFTSNHIIFIFDHLNIKFINLNEDIIHGINKNNIGVYDLGLNSTPIVYDLKLALAN